MVWIKEEIRYFQRNFQLQCLRFISRNWCLFNCMNKLYVWVTSLSMISSNKRSVLRYIRWKALNGLNRYVFRWYLSVIVWFYYVIQVRAGCVRYCVHVQYNGGVHPVLVSSVTHWSSSTRVEQVSTLSRRAISAVPTLSRMSVTESRYFLFSLLSGPCLELRNTREACKGPRSSGKIFWYTYPLSKLVQPVRKILWGEAQG